MSANVLAASDVTQGGLNKNSKGNDFFLYRQLREVESRTDPQTHLVAGADSLEPGQLAELENEATQVFQLDDESMPQGDHPHAPPRSGWRRIDLRIALEQQIARER